MTEQAPAAHTAQPIPSPEPAFYAQQPYAYRSPTRAPLSQTAKRGSFWAGAVGFNLLALGFSLVVIPLLAALFGAFLSFIVGQVFRSGRNSSGGLEELRHFFESLDYGLLAIIGLTAVIVGLLIITAALFTSATILKSRGVRRAWPVTWAGAGIATAASGIVGWILPLVFQLVAIVLVLVGVDSVVASISQAGLAFIGVVVGNAIIGWLSWWWMAHAMRPGAGAVPTNEIQE